MHADGRETKFQLIGGKAPVILLPATVNGTGPYNFILDSGASHCLISDTLAARLGISGETTEEAFGAGGATQLLRATVDSVAVGSARQEKAPFLITPDLASISTALKTTVDGAIGCSLLKDFLVTLDYQRNIARFDSPADGKQRTEDGVFFVPFTTGPAEPLTLVHATVNGTGPFFFVVDTAAGRSVISPAVASRANVEIGAAAAGKGVGGQIQMGRAKLNSIRVGDVTVRDHLVVVGDFLGAISKAVGAELDGIIGNNFLSEFRVTLDFVGQRLGLEPAGQI